MSLPREAIQIPSLVLWKEYCSIQGHFPAISRIVSVFAVGAEAVSSIKDYRLAHSHVFILSGWILLQTKLSLLLLLHSRLQTPTWRARCQITKGPSREGSQVMKEKTLEGNNNKTKQQQQKAW